MSKEKSSGGRWRGREPIQELEVIKIESDKLLSARSLSFHHNALLVWIGRPYFHLFFPCWMLGNLLPISNHRKGNITWKGRRRKRAEAGRQDQKRNLHPLEPATRSIQQLHVWLINDSTTAPWLSSSLIQMKARWTTGSFCRLIMCYYRRYRKNRLYNSIQYLLPETTIRL